MVKLTSEHWDAIEMRANGNTYATIALEQDCSIEVAKQRIAEVSRVLSLRLNAQQEDADGEDVGG